MKEINIMKYYEISEEEFLTKLSIDSKKYELTRTGDRLLRDSDGEEGMLFFTISQRETK